MRKLAARTFALVVVLAAASLTFSQSDDTLVVDLVSAWTTLDPAAHNDFPGAMTVPNICEGLLEIHPSDPFGPVTPNLASSYERSSDGTTFTFTLREGLTFHDGTPVNAEAVKFSFERSMSEAHPYYHPAMVQWKDNVYDIFESVEVIEDLVVQVTLSDPPSADAERAFTVAAIVSPSAVQELGADDFQTAPVCAGAYQLHEYDRSNNTIELRRFDAYWNSEFPKIGRVVYRVVPESTVRIAGLETGAADFIGDLPVDDVARLEANPNLQVIAQPGSTFLGLFVYQTVEPWNDKRVRQAIAYGIDRELMSQVVFGGAFPAANSNLMPFNVGWSQDLSFYPYDPERARELLAEAGYPDGFETFLQMPVTSGLNPAGVRWAEFIQQQLDLIGIDMEIEVLEGAAYWADNLDLTTNHAGLFLMGRSDFWGDPVKSWYGGYACVGWYEYCNPDVDQLLAEIVASTDASERTSLIQELGAVLDDDLPYIANVYPTRIHAASSDLADLYPSGLKIGLPLKHVYRE